MDGLNEWIDILFNANCYRECQKESDIVPSLCSFILNCGKTSNYFTNIGGMNTFRHTETNATEDF